MVVSQAPHIRTFIIINLSNSLYVTRTKSKSSFITFMAKIGCLILHRIRTVIENQLTQPCGLILNRWPKITPPKYKKKGPELGPLSLY